MANTLDTIMPKILARAMITLRQLCVMPRLVNGDYSTDAANKGDTVNVPVPTAVGVSDVTPSNTPPAPTNTVTRTVPIVLDQWKKSDPFYLTDKDFGLVNAQGLFLPMQAGEAVKALAAFVNSHLHGRYKKINTWTGTAATTPFASDATGATNARKLLNQQLAPMRDRRLVVDFTAEANMLALPAFSSAEKIGTNQVVIEGEIGRKYGFDIYADNQVATHTTVMAGTVLAAGAQLAGQGLNTQTLEGTFLVDGLTDQPAEGDLFTIAGSSQQYVVRSSTTISSTASTLTIYPALVANVADNAALTIVATHVVNIAFHRDAFAFATRPLVTSEVDLAANRKILSFQDAQTGLILRLEVLSQYKQTAWEFDILFGDNLIRPELATRLLG